MKNLLFAAVLSALGVSTPSCRPVRRVTVYYKRGTSFSQFVKWVYT